MQKKNINIKSIHYVSQKGSITLSVILLTLVIAGSAGYVFIQNLKSKLESRITGCTLVSENVHTVIDFDYVNNWIVVQVKVGGSEETYPFIFDTGAQTVVLDSLLNTLAKSDYQKLSFGTSSDSILHAFNNEIITLREIEIGGIVFKDIGSLSAQNSKWGMLNCISPYGIIGYNVLKTLNFQIDYAHKQIIFTDQVEQLNNYSDIQWVKYTPLSTQESPVIQGVMEDSLVVNLLFDTGMNGGISLSNEDIYAFFKAKNPNEIKQYTTVPTIRIRGESEAQLQSFSMVSQSFSIGALSFPNLELSVKNTSVREFDGTLGNQFFKNFIITLDYQNRRVGFIQQNEIARNANRFGISYTAQSDKLIVTQVYSGNTSSIEGIQAGDEIFSINGIEISSLSEETFCKIYRDEYNFSQPEDNTLELAVIKRDSTFRYTFIRGGY